MSKTTTVTRKPTKPVVAAKKKTAAKKAGKAKRIQPRKAKQATAKKAKGLFQFQGTPGGKLLRAYFIALIASQQGVKSVMGIKAGVPFRLWAGHFSGHTGSGRLVRLGAHAYQLSAHGVTFFQDTNEHPIPELYAAMFDAVTTGKKPDCFKRELTPLTPIGS